MLFGALAWCGAVAVCQADAGPEATISLRLQQGRPFVDVAINNVPVSLLLDFGGYDTIALNKADAEKAGVEANNSSRSFSSFDGKRHSSFGTHIKVAAVGGAIFREIDGSILGGEGNSYLGAGLLAKKLVVFDYLGNEVRLYQSGDAAALYRECGNDTFPVDVRRGVYQTYLRVGGKTLTAAFDTGANYSVVRPSWLNLEATEYVPGSSPKIHEFRNMRINNSNIEQLNAALIEFKGPPADIVLGGNFFSNRRVCLDGAAHVGAIRQY